MPLVVFLVGHYPENKDHPRIEMNCGDQPVRVSLDVKNKNRIAAVHFYRIHIIE
jgi:hypothetical protein